MPVTARTYDDFRVSSQPTPDGGYSAAVLRLAVGDAPTDSLQHSLRRDSRRPRTPQVELAVLRSHAKTRRRLDSQDRAVQDFGQSLFDALFSGEVRSLYDRACFRARERGDQGIRLKLRVEPPELARLPWSLTDHRGGEFLCLSHDSPLFGTCWSSNRRRPCMSNCRFASAWRRARATCRNWMSRVKELSSTLRRGTVRTADSLRCGRAKACGGGILWTSCAGPWHIFHFVGHGGFDASGDEGTVEFADEIGTRTSHHCYTAGAAYSRPSFVAPLSTRAKALLPLPRTCFQAPPPLLCAGVCRLS